MTLYCFSVLIEKVTMVTSLRHFGYMLGHQRHIYNSHCGFLVLHLDDNLSSSVGNDTAYSFSVLGAFSFYIFDLPNVMCFFFKK